MGTAHHTRIENLGMRRFVPQFGLDSVMLFTGLIAVCAAIVRFCGAAGVPLVLLCGLALARTVSEIGNDPDPARRMFALDKITLYLVSFSLILVAGGAGVGALALLQGFGRACGLDFELSTLLGMPVAGLLGYGTYWLIGRSIREPRL